jgi:hypothetical protein
VTIWREIEKALTPDRGVTAGEDIADTVALMVIMGLVLFMIFM